MIAPRTVRCAACGSLHVPPLTVQAPAWQPIEPEALRMLAVDLEGCRDDFWRFMQCVWAPTPGYLRVGPLADDLGGLKSTLQSRFFRAALPTPRDFLFGARLARAARLLERPEHSIERVGHALDASSPQAFGRSIRTAMGCSALEFRQRYDGAAMLTRFRSTLILPYREQLLDFSPLVEQPIHLARARRSA